MVSSRMNLVEVGVEKDSVGNPATIIWSDGRRFSISSSGGAVLCPSRKPGKFAYVRDVYIIGKGNKTYRRSLVADDGKWFIESFK